MNHYALTFSVVFLAMWILILKPPAWCLRLAARCRDFPFVCLFAISFVVMFADFDIPNFIRLIAFIVLAFSYVALLWIIPLKIKGENLESENED